MNVPVYTRFHRWPQRLQRNLENSWWTWRRRSVCTVWWNTLRKIDPRSWMRQRMLDLFNRCQNSQLSFIGDLQHVGDKMSANEALRISKPLRLGIEMKYTLTGSIACSYRIRTLQTFNLKHLTNGVSQNRLRERRIIYNMITSLYLLWEVYSNIHNVDIPVLFGSILVYTKLKYHELRNLAQKI